MAALQHAALSNEQQNPQTPGQYKSIKNNDVSSGFDGIHLGHSKIFHPPKSTRCHT